MILECQQDVLAAGIVMILELSAGCSSSRRCEDAGNQGSYRTESEFTALLNLSKQTFRKAIFSAGSTTMPATRNSVLLVRIEPVVKSRIYSCILSFFAATSTGLVQNLNELFFSLCSQSSVLT